MDAISAASAAMGTLSTQKSDAASARVTAAENQSGALRQAAEEFEATFLSQMFSHMFENIKTDSLFGGGHGEEMFRSMLIDGYAQEIVKKGGIGIADSVMRTLLTQQEKSS